jgi:hypothetical protein
MAALAEATIAPTTTAPILGPAVLTTVDPTPPAVSAAAASPPLPPPATVPSPSPTTLPAWIKPQSCGAAAPSPKNWFDDHKEIVPPGVWAQGGRQYGLSRARVCTIAGTRASGDMFREQIQRYGNERVSFYRVTSMVMDPSDNGNTIWIVDNGIIKCVNINDGSVYLVGFEGIIPTQTGSCITATRVPTTIAYQLPPSSTLSSTSISSSPSSATIPAPCHMIFSSYWALKMPFIRLALGKAEIIMWPLPIVSSKPTPTTTSSSSSSASQYGQPNAIRPIKIGEMPGIIPYMVWSDTCQSLIVSQGRHPRPVSLWLFKQQRCLAAAATLSLPSTSSLSLSNGSSNEYEWICEPLEYPGADISGITMDIDGITVLIADTQANGALQRKDFHGRPITSIIRTYNIRTRRYDIVDTRDRPHFYYKVRPRNGLCVDDRGYVYWALEYGIAIMKPFDHLYRYPFSVTDIVSACPSLLRPLHDIIHGYTINEMVVYEPWGGGAGAGHTDECGQRAHLHDSSTPIWCHINRRVYFVDQNRHMIRYIEMNDLSDEHYFED